jgi:glycosyltransferase involved in cell wall biosynthesis
MKILYHFRTRGTGAEAVHISGVARAFERLGHEVVFSSPTGVDPRKSAGADPFAKKGGSMPGFVFELMEIAYNAVAFFKNARLVRRLRPGLIYERHAFFLFSTALLARLARVPLVVEVNELVGDARIRKGPLLRPLARLADAITFRAASAIVVVSPHLQRKIMALGIPQERILVLPNAVDEDDFREPPDGRDVRAKLGLDRELVLGFVGWFVEWHKLEMLLEVFAGLAAEFPGARLMLVGSGTLEEPLKKLAQDLGIAERILWPGAVPHDEVRGYIAAMDICIVPHSNEYRSPIKLFEYMALARPVVAPATEPVAMVVADGRNGFLFTPGDAADLRATFQKIMGDEKLRRAVGNAARDCVMSRHTWTQNAGAVLDAACRGYK